MKQKTKQHMCFARDSDDRSGSTRIAISDIDGHSWYRFSAPVGEAGDSYIRPKRLTLVKRF